MGLVEFGFNCEYLYKLLSVYSTMDPDSKSNKVYRLDKSKEKTDYVKYKESVLDLTTVHLSINIIQVVIDI